MLIIILRWQSCSNTPLEEASHLPEKIKKHPIRISMAGATRHMLPSFFHFLTLISVNGLRGPRAKRVWKRHDNAADKDGEDRLC